MRRWVEDWSLNDAPRSHQHEAAPGWADRYVGRRENAKKDFFFSPPKNRHGILTEAPHKVLEIQNHVGLSTSPETSFRRTGHRALGQLAFQLTLLFPTSVSNLSPLHRP